MTCPGPDAIDIVQYLVLLEGLEPPRHEGQRILNPLGLPFPYTTANLVP